VYNETTGRLEAKGEEIMAMLILTQEKCVKVPQCECGSNMIPKDLRNIGKDWKCPDCKKTAKERK
jgi:predicted RNA-binding Zn-ribbon protein involved in translation (DUF1610 family)